MIQLLADYILSPLGAGTDANLDAVLRGETRLRLHEDAHGEWLPQPFVGSLFDTLPAMDGYTPFEALCITAAEEAIRQSGVDVMQPDCVFILSTTKGNIWSSPAESARKVARHFGNLSTPVVVSTACTSGVSAQVVAHRLLTAGGYRTAVVIGCDVQSAFIVSGFQAFKALSPERCRPFDAARQGLNAGEAVAVMVVTSETSWTSETIRTSWLLRGGSLHNDANHISAPSRTGEGSLRCLQDALALVRKEDLAFVSLHGTGTAYNDEMESIALHRAGLDQTPVSALKGYYGHTMGAAGLLETILSLHAIDRGIIPASMGFTEQGTTYPVGVSAQPRETKGTAFIKLLSGFGGINAVVAWERGEENSETSGTSRNSEPSRLVVADEVRLGSEADLVGLYRQVCGDYPKFFKMDTLCRLGFVAAEMLIGRHKDEVGAERTIVILANRSASRKNDTDYKQTISDRENFFPSPALFVYTLPNIVAGELAIRHHLMGETAFYVLEREEDLMPLIEATMRQTDVRNAIAGWVECADATHYEAHMRWIIKQ